MRREFKVPRMEEVLEHDRKLLFALKQSMGFVPNVYAFMTRSETALKRFMDFMDVSTVFDRIQTEAIHLVTSQVNQNPYCLAAHTALAKEAGLLMRVAIAVTEVLRLESLFLEPAANPCRWRPRAIFANDCCKTFLTIRRLPWNFLPVLKKSLLAVKLKRHEKFSKFGAR